MRMLKTMRNTGPAAIPRCFSAPTYQMSDIRFGNRVSQSTVAIRISNSTAAAAPQLRSRSSRLLIAFLVWIRIRILSRLLEPITGAILVPELKMGLLHPSADQIPDSDLAQVLISVDPTLTCLLLFITYCFKIYLFLEQEQRNTLDSFRSRVGIQLNKT